MISPRPIMCIITLPVAEIIIKKNVYELSENKVLTVNRAPNNLSSYHV